MKIILLLCLHLAFAAYQGGYQSQANGGQYQQSPMGSPYQQPLNSQYQQPGVEVFDDNMGSEVETEWERCIEAIADLQLQQNFDHLGDPTHLEKQTAVGILTFRFQDGMSATFQENGPGMLPSLQSCDIPPGSAVQMQCVPQPPQPELPPQGAAQADQTPRKPEYPSGRPGMSQARPQGQPARQPPMRPGAKPVKPGYQPHPMNQQGASSHLSPSQQKEMDEESQKCLESRDCNNCMDAGPTCLWDLNKQNCYHNSNIFNIPPNTAHDKSKCPSKPKTPENNAPQGYGGGPYPPPQQNGGGIGNNGPQNSGGYMNNGPQNGGGFMNNGPQNGGFGNKPQNMGYNNGPQNGGYGGNNGGFNSGGYGGHPQGNMGGGSGGAQGQGQWGQNNGPQHGGYGGHNGGFNGGYGGNPQGNMGGGGFGGPQGGQGMMGGYGPSQLTVAEFETKWEDAMAAATPKELKALGVTLDDLEVFDEPVGVTEQVVQGMNYDFEFEDGTHVIVNEQSWMDPPVLKIMEVIPAQPANGGGNGGPPGPGGRRPRLSRTHIADEDESSVNKLLIFTMILWGVVVGIIAGLTISYANENCYKKTSQEDMYIDLTLDAQQRKV